MWAASDVDTSNPRGRAVASERHLHIVLALTDDARPISSEEQQHLDASLAAAQLSVKK